jgi:NADH-quinone oxidoreductase subunit A
MLTPYIPVIVQILFAICFVAIALFCSVLLGKTGRRNPVKDSPYECGMLPIGSQQPRFTVKFYLAAMLFILFDLEIVFMYPWALAFREYIKTQGLTILWSMLSFIGVVTVGYIYAIKKGVLNWQH